VPGLVDCLAASSRPTDQQQRRPDGHTPNVGIVAPDVDDGQCLRQECSSPPNIEVLCFAVNGGAEFVLHSLWNIKPVQLLRHLGTSWLSPPRAGNCYGTTNQTDSCCSDVYHKVDARHYVHILWPLLLSCNNLFISWEVVLIMHICPTLMGIIYCFKPCTCLSPIPATPLDLTLCRLVLHFPSTSCSAVCATDQAWPKLVHSTVVSHQ